MTFAEFLKRFPRVRVEVVWSDDYEGSPDNPRYEADVVEVVPQDGDPYIPSMWLYSDAAATLIHPGDIVERSDGKVEVHDRTHDDWYVVEAV